MGIVNFYAFLMAVIGFVLLPGPSSLYILSISTRTSHKNTLGGILGVFLGDTILILGSFVGLAGVMQDPTVYGVMKFLGAFYLLYIGLKIISDAIGQVLKKALPTKLSQFKLKRKRKQPPPANQQPPAKSGWGFFVSAFMISLLNPKAIFFFLSFFLQFIDPTYPHPVVPFLIQATIVQVGNVLFLIGVMYFGQKALPFFERQVYLQRAIFLAIGGLFVSYGVVLLLY